MVPYSDTDQGYLRRIVQILSSRAGGAYPPKPDDSINRLLTKWAKLIGAI
jgi:hypothetical protein